MSASARVKVGDGQLVEMIGDLNRDTVMTCWPDQASDLQKFSDTKGGMIISLEQVENVDTAGLAWLLHLLKACNQIKLDVKIQKTPDSLLNLALLSNVKQLLPLE